MGQGFRDFLNGWLSLELQRALDFLPILIAFISSCAVGDWSTPLFCASGELPLLGASLEEFDSPD